jgi:HAD superfamily hydrolase (TIGR01484 family)
MRYHVLASDYDGTLATHGHVDEATLKALDRLRDSGRKLVLVTGRELDELVQVFPQVNQPNLFQSVVAENGALLYCPETREEKVLVDRPPKRFAQALRERRVDRVSEGRVIVATWEPHENIVLDVIREMGLELQVIFNKGAVMVLPSGVNKASGLKHALLDLGLSHHNTVGIGDAENDHAFLNYCECSVAVANALPVTKEYADYVTRSDHGAGVVEIIDLLVANDLHDLEPRLSRHEIPLVAPKDNREIRVRPYGTNILIACCEGESSLGAEVLNRFAEREYQFCVVDSRGHLASCQKAVALGDSKTPPVLEDVLELLARPNENAIVSLGGLAFEHRREYVDRLLLRLQELRTRAGHPHWIVLNAAHELFPKASASIIAEGTKGLVFMTAQPEQLSPTVASSLDLVIP